MDKSLDVVSRLTRDLEILKRDWTVPADIVNDPDIHDVERSQLWTRSWVFLGHESEIPKPGDYVVRKISDSEFIVTRDEKGTIRAHFNSCRHRGMQLCRAEKGNTSHYRCPFHGWTFNNKGNLVGVPAGREVYGPGLVKSDWGLRPAPQLDTYKGLIFGCLDANASSLTDFLGSMTYYLDLLVDRTDLGLEVVGAPQRWIVDANWKLGADNFVGDGYHTLMTHRSMIDLGMFPDDPKFAMYGEQVSVENGHGMGFVGAPPGVSLPPFLALPEEVTSQFSRRLSPGQVEILRNTSLFHGNVFPNFAIGNFLVPKDLKSPPSSFVTFRVWHPISSSRMEVWSWFLVDREAPESFREESRAVYVNLFGPGGVIEQDDAEIWRGVTRVLGGQFAQGEQLNYQMGRGLREVDKNWPGPGEAHNLDYGDLTCRRFYEQWMNYMISGDNPLARVDPAVGLGNSAQMMHAPATGGGQ